MHAEPESNQPSLWVLVGEAEVLAGQAPRSLQNGADCGQYVRATLARHGLAVAGIPTPYRLSMRREAQLFRMPLELRRHAFHRKVLQSISRLERYLEECGEAAPDLMGEAETVGEYGLRILACGKTLLRQIARDPTCKYHDVFVPGLRDTVALLAQQMSARLTVDSMFYDAIAQSVSIPTWAEIERRASARDDEFWLVPVNLA